jgi:hypothetical protein
VSVAVFECVVAITSATVINTARLNFTRNAGRFNQHLPKKGTFYFTRQVPFFNVRQCQEHPEHPKAVSFIMS